MNIDREQAIAWAREAGVTVQEPSWGYTESHQFSAFEEPMMRFADLVAAAEREACAKVCEGVDFKDVQDAVEYAHVFAAAIRARGGAT